MPRKKKPNDYGTGIPYHEVEALARILLPEIQAFFESEEGQREFAEWKAQQEQNKVKASKAMTILLGKEGKVYYYMGEPDYENPEMVQETDFSPNGLRAILLGRNQAVMQKIRELKQKKANLEISNEEYLRESAEIRKAKDSPVVLIKATDFANYRNLIDVLDEMQICNIGRYAIMDITPGDLRLLQDKTHDGYADDLKEVIEYRELKP